MAPLATRPADRSSTGHSGPVTLIVRPAEGYDAGFLAEMLVAAAFWPADGPSGSVLEVLGHPQFAHYIAGWPRPGDLGVIALSDQQPVGAAWARMLPKSDPATVSSKAIAPRCPWAWRRLGGAVGWARDC